MDYCLPLANKMQRKGASRGPDAGKAEDQHLQEVQQVDGREQHRVREPYLESCSGASARWRSEFTRRQDAKAAARVAALHTYDAKDNLTLAGTPSHM
jgi:hypothetical protein